MPMRENKLLLQNTEVWEPIGPEEDAIIRQLVWAEDSKGLRAIRKVGTYIGVIFTLACLSGGQITVTIATALLVLTGNIFVRWHTKREARDIAMGGLYTAPGVCTNTQVQLVTGSEHSSLHFNGTFRMKNGSAYTIEVTQTNAGRLEVGDTLVFVKRHSGRGGLAYFSQAALDWHINAQDGQREETTHTGYLQKDWLEVENWREAKGKFCHTLLNECAAHIGVGGANLAIGFVSLLFLVLIPIALWPLDTLHAITVVLILYMAFGPFGATALRDILNSTIGNIFRNARLRMRCPLYYCSGQCTKITRGGSYRKSIAHIQLSNGLRYALPLSDKNRASIGPICCVNTRLAYGYKNKYIIKPHGFRPARYERKLYFISLDGMD